MIVLDTKVGEMFADLFGGIAFVVVGVVLLGIALWGLLSYIFTSLSLYKIARRNNVKLSGFAWIPLLRRYVLGGIADADDAAIGKRNNWAKTQKAFIIIDIITLVLTYITYTVLAVNGAIDSAALTALSLPLIILLALAALVCLVASIAGMIIDAICYFKTYELCRPGKAVKYLILSIIFPVFQWIILLICRKYQNGERV